MEALCDDDDDDDDDESYNNGLSVIFISLPTFDEHLNAALSADHSIPARVVRSPSVGIHLVGVHYS